MVWSRSHIRQSEMIVCGHLSFPNRLDVQSAQLKPENPRALAAKGLSSELL